jgi:hypothetical protein
MLDPIHKPPTRGFRFSLADAVVMAAFAGAAFYLWRLGNPLWWMLAITAGHFFLFCNVFRMARRRELIWAVVFILNIGAWAWSVNLTWIRVLLCQLPITAGLVIGEMREPGYHGVFANRLNRGSNGYSEEPIPEIGAEK